MSLSDPSVGVSLVVMGYPVLVDPPPPEARAGEWLPLAEVHRPERILDMVEAYTRWLDVGHRAAGGACASQHYAGRIAGYLVGTWALTNGVASLRDPRVLAEVDAHGRTLRLAIPREPETAPGDVTALVRGIQLHLAPLLDAVCIVSGITSRLAWGGVATSVAGAFARAVRTLPEPRKHEVADAARTALDPARWPTDRPLLDLSSDAQSHVRRTCCLIFLSPTHGECQTCPRTVRPQR